MSDLAVPTITDAGLGQSASVFPLSPPLHGRTQRGCSLRGSTVRAQERIRIMGFQRLLEMSTGGTASPQRFPAAPAPKSSQTNSPGVGHPRATAGVNTHLQWLKMLAGYTLQWGWGGHRLPETRHDLTVLHQTGTFPFFLRGTHTAPHRPQY